MLFKEETQEKVPSRPFYTTVDAAHKVEIKVDQCIILYMGNCVCCMWCAVCCCGCVTVLVSSSSQQFLTSNCSESKK